MREPKYVYRAKLKKVVDGDTLDLRIDTGFHLEVTQRIRFKGIDTPEIFGVRKDTPEYKSGIKAKEYVEKRFQDNDGNCIIKTYNIGKYGRWIADIFLADSELSLNQELLDKELAEDLSY